LSRSDATAKQAAWRFWYMVQGSGCARSNHADQKNEFLKKHILPYTELTSPANTADQCVLKELARGRMWDFSSATCSNFGKVMFSNVCPGLAKLRESEKSRRVKADGWHGGWHV